MSDLVVDAIKNSAGNSILGWQFVSSQTASNDATLEFTWAADLYKSVLFEFVLIAPASDGYNFDARYSEDGSTWNSAADYSWVGHLSTHSVSTTTATYAAAQTNTRLYAGSLGNAAGETFGGTLQIMGVNDATAHWAVVNAAGINSTGNAQHISNAHRMSGTAQIRGAQFYMATGNISSGTINLYGMKA